MKATALIRELQGIVDRVGDHDVLVKDVEYGDFVAIDSVTLQAKHLHRTLPIPDADAFIAINVE